MCDFALQRAIKKLAFALQHRVLCIAAPWVLYHTMVGIPSEDPAAKYHRIKPGRLKLEFHQAAEFSPWSSSVEATRHSDGARKVRLCLCTAGICHLSG